MAIRQQRTRGNEPGSVDASYLYGYNIVVYTILRTKEFVEWLATIADPKARARIFERIRSAEFGNFGDSAPVGEGVFEMRIHLGPGYRLYYMRQGQTVYLLLCGGTKRRQQADIRRAKEMARQLKEGTS